jgi:hypothetical protein
MMVSFDIKSLYTNIPVKEAIDICVTKLFPDENSLVLGLSSSQYKILLNLALTDSVFLFNGDIYKQIDGLAMGNPIAPSVANIFMSHLEEQYLTNCPTQHKPIFYRRYLDDTFVLFYEPYHADQFLKHINECHPNIQFTMEKEHDCKLSFLDTTVFRKEAPYSGIGPQSTFETSIFRKPTFSGLGTSFYSFTPFKYRINAIKTLVHRAFKLSSNFHFFHKEVLFLQTYFHSNGYPRLLVDSIIGKCLNSVFIAKPNNFDVPKQTIYFSFPYYGDWSTKLEKELVILIAKFYPQIDTRISFINKFTLSSILKTKESLPTQLRSNIIYEYKCGACQASYIGQSCKVARFRWSQHLGISSRTFRRLGKTDQSAVREHSELTDHPISMQNFSIIDQTNNYNDRKILESLYIKQHKPALNIATPSLPLHVVQ